MGEVVQGPFGSAGVDIGIETAFRPRHPRECLYDYLLSGTRELAAENRALHNQLDAQRAMRAEHRAAAVRRLKRLALAQAMVTGLAAAGAGMLLGNSLWSALAAALLVAVIGLLGAMALARQLGGLDRAPTHLRDRLRGRRP